MQRSSEPFWERSLWRALASSSKGHFQGNLACFFYCNSPCKEILLFRWKGPCGEIWATFKDCCIEIQDFDRLLNFHVRTFFPIYSLRSPAWATFFLQHSSSWIETTPSGMWVSKPRPVDPSGARSSEVAPRRGKAKAGSSPSSSLHEA